jgi:hypothetical protein
MEKRILHRKLEKLRRPYAENGDYLEKTSWKFPQQRGHRLWPILTCAFIRIQAIAMNPSQTRINHADRMQEAANAAGACPVETCKKIVETYSNILYYSR